VFSWSCSWLPGDAALAFRLLGLHPGADLQAGALAALTGTATAAEAQHALGVLARANLVRQSAMGRYGMHGLLRAYAHELAVATDTALHRRVALTRLLEHYLHTAAHAMGLLFPARRQHRADRAHLHPLATPLPDAVAARSWLEAERANLVALTVHAGRHGWPQHAIGLAQTVAHYLDSGRYPAEALAIHGSALAAARVCGDRAAETMAMRQLAAISRSGEPDGDEALDGHRLPDDPARPTAVPAQPRREPPSAPAGSAAVGVTRSLRISHTQRYVAG
jgi:hypothetical protein